MGLSRSTFYDAPSAHFDDAEIVRRMLIFPRKSGRG